MLLKKFLQRNVNELVSLALDTSQANFIPQALGNDLPRRPDVCSPSHPGDQTFVCSAKLDKTTHTTFNLKRSTSTHYAQPYTLFTFNHNYPKLAISRRLDCASTDASAKRCCWCCCWCWIARNCCSSSTEISTIPRAEDADDDIEAK
jgi:hypothetical protein